ncbi:hypothetical protein [Neolewinella sp.]|uniref:hypothetical protein n=1 Tax=Neolewinella sp. TaxID=2993543 RepID=UPI003B516A16
MLLRLLICCLLSAPLAAQALLDTLAEKVCNCMDKAPELIYPRLQASHCVTAVSTTYAGRIRTELQLSTRTASDRQRLGELLVDPLTSGCPLLGKLSPGTLEPQRRYSDFSLLRRVPSAAEVNRRPAASPAAATAREAPTLLRVRGTLTQPPSDDRLRVLLPEGKVISFLLPRNLQRKLDVRRGQLITVVYREDWRSDGRTVQPTVVRLE